LSRPGAIVEQRAPLFGDARPAARLVLGACSVEIRTAELRAKRLDATEDFLRPFNLAAASLSPAPSRFDDRDEVVFIIGMQPAKRDERFDLRSCLMVSSCVASVGRRERGRLGPFSVVWAVGFLGISGDLLPSVFYSGNR
jgi:hypothetical protein